MTVYLTNTTKKHNSTAIPAVGRSVSCVLKEGCSIIDPVLIFERANVGHDYNYVYIPDFKRRYFVDNIEYQNARIIYYCSVDVLGTYKAEIGASSQYVLRSASQKNGYIPDGLYPLTSEVQTESYNLASFSWTYNTYVMGIASNGGITYYLSEGSSIDAFITALISKDYAEDVLGKLAIATNPSLKMMVDPLQYIVSFKWLPVSFSTMQSHFSGKLTSVSTIKVGYGDVVMGSGQLYKYTGSYQEFIYSTSGAIGMLVTPSHPQASSRGAYLNAPPFTEAKLVTPSGMIDIDFNEMFTLSHGTQIDAEITMDVSNGYTIVQLSTTYAGVKTIYVRTAFTLGVDVPITQIVSKGFNVLSLGSEMVSGTITGLLAGGAVGAGAGAIGSTVSGIMEQQANRVPKVVSAGSNSGGYNYAKDIPLKVQVVYYLVADNDNDQHGSPLYKKKQISTLSGFVLCDCDDFGISGTKEEAIKVIGYMNSGFYYE